MTRLTVGEWIAVVIAIGLAFSIFVVGGAFNSESVPSADEVVETPTEDGTVAGDSIDIVEGDVETDVEVVPTEEGGAAGTFEEGQVPSDLAPEDAAAL